MKVEKSHNLSPAVWGKTEKRVKLFPAWLCSNQVPTKNRVMFPDIGKQFVLPSLLSQKQISSQSCLLGALGSLGIPRPR